MKINLNNINVTLQKNSILQNVSLEIADGSFMSVLGKSGAGKSTLLSVISGLLLQSDGHVLFDDTCIDSLPTHKRDISVVFQDSRLFPNMNVLDNVAFPLKMRGESKSPRHEKAQELLAAVQLEGFGNRRTYELSGGQRQRVALARAFAGNPRAVLLDEPFSGLDEYLRDEMRELVQQLHQQFRITTIMVTHDGFEALRLSDCVAYMNQGRIVQVGAPAELLLHPGTPEVASCFGQTNALEGSVSAETFCYGKLIVPAPGIEDGPAILLHTAAGTTRVIPSDTHEKLASNQ